MQVRVPAVSTGIFGEMTASVLSLIYIYYVYIKAVVSMGLGATGQQLPFRAYVSRYIFYILNMIV